MRRSARIRAKQSIKDGTEGDEDCDGVENRDDYDEDRNCDEDCDESGGLQRQLDCDRDNNFAG